MWRRCLFAFYTTGSAGKKRLAAQAACSGYDAPSGDIVLLVRPEDIGLQHDAQGPHAIPAVVIGIRYKGSVTEVDLQLSDFTLMALEFSKYIWRVDEQMY